MKKIYKNNNNTVREKNKKTQKALGIHHFIFTITAVSLTVCFNQCSAIESKIMFSVVSDISTFASTKCYNTQLLVYILCCFKIHPDSDRTL